MTTPAETDWTSRTGSVSASELHVLEAVGNPGAMGTVYWVAGQPPCLYKKYVNPSIHAARLDRLITWRNSLSVRAREFLDSRCAWPLVTVTENGETAGFLMRSAPDKFWADMAGERHTLELQNLIHTAGAKTFGIELPGPEQRLALIGSLANILAFLEAHEFVYGDVNERNVLWTLADSPRVFLIDCDNARPANLPGPRAGVAMPRNASWRDPDLPEGGYPDINSDRYTLAVFCYRVFYEYYLRPGVAKASLDDDRNKVLLPEAAPHLAALERVLSYGLGQPQTRPSGAQWISAIKDIDLSAPQPDSTIPLARLQNGQSKQRFASHSGSRRVIRVVVPAVAVVMLAAVALVLTLVMHVFAAPLSLPQYLASWSAGPVKISVPHYWSTETQASKESSGKWARVNANWGNVLLRISVRNLTGQPLSLDCAYNQLVLVVDAPFPRESPTLVSAKPVVSVPPRLHLYYVGFYNDTWNVQDLNNKNHTSGWTGKTLAAGATFESSNVRDNSAIYTIPPTALGGVVSGEPSVGPVKFHILGVAWLKSDGQVLGFCPVSAWRGDNSMTSFLAG